MGETQISWTHYSFNPWIGCVKVSEGCLHCYAETLATGKMGLQVWGPKADRYVTKTTWKQPVKWNKEAVQAGERRRVFCASMADVFEKHPALEEPRQRLWKLIEETPMLDWLLLTKRPENIVDMLPARWAPFAPNVWLGVSAENQRRWNERVPILASIPAAVRFVSYEPALGPLNIRETGYQQPDWLIAGGESGPDRRPFDEDWARRVRDDCQTASIAFFYKQKGGLRPEGKVPPLLDGRIHHEYPRPIEVDAAVSA